VFIVGIIHYYSIYYPSSGVTQVWKVYMYKKLVHLGLIEHKVVNSK